MLPFVPLPETAIQHVEMVAAAEYSSPVELAIVCGNLATYTAYVGTAFADGIARQQSDRIPPWYNDALVTMRGKCWGNNSPIGPTNPIQSIRLWILG